MFRKHTISSLIRPTLGVIWLVISLWPVRVYAQADILPGTAEPNKIHITSGKSVVVRASEPVKRVSIASPEIAGYLVLSPKEVYITGKSAGTTNMILWQDGQVVGIYDILVTYDVSMLKEKLHEVLPSETDLNVSATHDSITLSGRVSSAAALSQATTLAKAYAPEGKVNNLIEVGGVQQVMLEVRIAEMQRSTARRLGVNFSSVRGPNDFGVSTLGGLTEVAPLDDATIDSGGGPFGFIINPVVNALFRFSSGSRTWTGFIDLLKQEGLLKVLAEPTLIALSGQTATFLAGGEFPIPVPQGLGTVAIEYRSFGVTLAFTPTVIGADKISMKVAPEVSELDFSTAVRFSGFVVPGLSTRRASTVIELADGQSFAIAGLIRDTARDQYDKFPVLGDIPILGNLFRSRSFQRNETELVIIATPHLAKPIDASKQPLPTDYYIEPNDEEFYLLGQIEGDPQNANSAPRAKLDGEFGHELPKY